MQSLIPSFLFLNKKCSLPGIGTLSVADLPARSDFANKQVTAPRPQFVFSTASINEESDLLIEYIATKKMLSRNESSSMLNDFCGQLENKKDLSIKQVGLFTIDADHKIKFEPAQLPEIFLQNVAADRVIHPEAEHSILVGDTETTNTAMTEYYIDEPVKKSRWWLAALILSVISAAMILIYFLNNGQLL
ncbi:MAG: hypothetical protein ABJA78_20560 [Ferruginibacter sp.]